MEHLTTTKSQECDGYPHKRQKTCSPQPSAVPITPVKITQTLGWEEQLIKAGFAGSSSPVQDEAASEMVEVVGTTTENTGDARPDVTTPSKRVMRLRTDGRLVSPKTRKDNTAQLPISRRGGRKPHTYTRLRIITLKYGIAGVSVHDMGQKIEDILCGKTRVVATNEAKPQSEPKLQSQPQPAKMISAQPAKTTHPFFTGKTTHLKVALLTERAQEESEDALSSRRRSTSPPLNPAKASSSWTGFGSSFTKKPKLPGTSPAPWPPKDIVHVRGIPEYSIPLYKSSLNLPQRRLKCSEPRLAAFEEVLSPLRSSIASMRDDRPMRQFHRPRRRLMTGTELQSLIRSRLSNATPSSSRTSVPDDEDELVGQAPPESVPLHPASQNLFAQLQNTMSAFDTFACEQKEWTHKYAPKTVTEILQQDQNLLLLKEWLLSLTVNSVNSSADNLKEKKAALARKLKAKRKKRKAEDELADFLVSTDSELDDADQFSDMESTTIGTGGDSDIRRLTERNITKTSAVVLSGPSGSGKTSAVYAAASELGFEIFEINSGVRRSGRDIVDKVGDMTRNHLVKRSGNSKTYVDESDAVPLDCQAEVDSGKQSTMNVFFKSKAHVAESQAKKPAKKDGKPSQLGKQPTKKQKQSLVLLEEVDVLFDEDKHFWSTVISLLLESRRPVVLTCTDETILPVHEISGLSALRVTRSPETLAVDYLLLLAANEGHLLTRNAVTDLYRAQGSDLRATIMQLNFLCQMALGDTKGGLEWLLIRSGDEGQDGKGRPLRIISEDTIMRHMPVLMPDAEERLRTPLDADLYSLLDAHTNWDFDPEDWLDQQPPEASASSSLVSLRRLELATEALSAADVMPGSSLLEPDAVSWSTKSPELLLTSPGPPRPNAAVAQRNRALELSGGSPSPRHTFTNRPIRALSKRCFVPQTSRTPDSVRSAATTATSNARATRAQPTPYPVHTIACSIRHSHLCTLTAVYSSAVYGLHKLLLPTITQPTSLNSGAYSSHGHCAFCAQHRGGRPRA